MHYHGNRLRKGRYSETGRPYLITTVTYNRSAVFSHLQPARLLVFEMRRLHSDDVVQSLAWVIMPDHVHWLLVVRQLPLSDVDRLLKGRSARRIQRASGVAEQLWQKGFHDHALRQDEDIKAVARYIIANPLRAGLVENIGDYPHWDAAWM